MSSRIKETVDLLAKASGNEPIFSEKAVQGNDRFEVLLELQNEDKTKVQRQFSNRVNIGQVLTDSATGTKARVLTVIRLQ